MSFPHLVPLPSSVRVTDARPFALTDDVRVTGDADAAAALRALLEALTGKAPAEAEEGGIRLQVAAGGPAESYRLVIDEASVVLTAADAAGLFYGIQTLAQLLSRDPDDPESARWFLPAVEIDDEPRFAYRGMMLDVARHFFSVDTVKACVDRAASLKFNHLHLHLTDDQGWRVELESRPLLTALASGSAVGGDPGGHYTKADYREIVEYAASRHMTVVPEVDMPGHTHAVGLAYPELAESPVLSEHVADVAEAFGGGLPIAGAPYTGMAVGFSSLRIHDEATYDFVADVFGELAGMTPGPYLHVGGDEALGTEPEDFAVFLERVTDIVADLGKTPVAWHEAGAAKGLHPDTVGQYWGFTTPTDGMDDRARAFAANGSQVILSPADAVYLDMKYDDGTPLGLTWANGPTSVRRAYEWEPSTVIPGLTEADILGVEAPLWTETVRDLDDIDLLAFPRIAAAAEAAWSPPTGTPRRTWESFRTRLGGLGPLWTSAGIRFHPSEEIPWSRR